MIFVCAYAYIQIYIIFEMFVYFVFGENTTEKNQNSFSNGSKWRKQGCWLTDSKACFWTVCILVCACLHLAERTCVCVRVEEGGERRPLYQQLDWEASPSFSRVPTSLCPLILRPFIGFVYYLFDFMMALWSGALLARNCLWHWLWVWDD